jgi:hypothetical protein
MRFIESLSTRLPDECLNEQVFLCFASAQSSRPSRRRQRRLAGRPQTL